MTITAFRHFSYDDMNRLIAVKGIDGATTKYSYDALGRRIATDGAKEDTVYAYDEVGNLISQTTTGAYDLALEYAYDLSGRMTSESRTENGATLTSSYVYDTLGQLTSFARSDGQSENYTYDPVGNMTAKTQNGVSTAMRYNVANQLVQSVTGGETTKYSYDANGNLTRSENAAGARSYAYNALNLLQSFTREDGYTENYSYNANRLLSEIRTSEDLTTTLTWDILYGDGVVISAAQNGETTNYTYGLERISAITGRTRTEYVYDGRGSVAAEVSYNNAWYTFGGGLARKNVTAKSYTPFGEQIGELTSGFGYNGEYYNAATGMIYLRARFYEPEINRFSQKDILRGSIIDGNSLNRYLYCQNDPVNFADYNGLQMVNVCVADGGGSGRRVTPNQTTSIVTKPGQNSVSSASAASRTVAVPMTDTGTGGYSSAYSAAGAVTGYGNGQGNQGTQTGTSQTSNITPKSPIVQDVTGSERYSCGRDLQNSNANIENIMRFFGVSSPEDIPELPENAMVVLENTRSIGPIVEGRAVVMDSDKYAEYVFFGVNWSLSGLGLSGKIFNGADISVTGDFVYNVNSPSDYAGVFIATSSVFEGISVGGAVSPGSNVYSTIMGGESQLAGSVTIVSGMYYFALSDEWIYDEAPISWYTKDNSNLRPDEQGAWY